MKISNLNVESFHLEADLGKQEVEFHFGFSDKSLSILRLDGPTFLAIKRELDETLYDHPEIQRWRPRSPQSAS